MNTTTDSVLSTNLTDLSVLRCVNLTSHNATNNNTLPSGGSPCNSTLIPSVMVPKSGQKPHGGQNIKVIHMQAKEDSGNRLYLSYDPMIGIRTASILGSALFLMMVYILYKAKCRRRTWTSEDQLFLEKYRRRIHDRYRKNNRHGSHSSHWSMGTSVKDSFAMENTAKWIQSQPLNTAVPKKTLKTMSNMCNICIDSFHIASCPMCSNSDLQVSHGPLDTPLSPDSGLASFQKARNKHRVDRALLDVCHLHLPGVLPPHKDTQLIENDIHQDRIWHHRTRKSKNSNLELDHSATPSPSPNYEDMFKFDEKISQQNRQKNLEGIRTARSFQGYLPSYELPNGVASNRDKVLLPPDLNCSRSPGSSHSDSIDLEKNIDVGVNDTSPSAKCGPERPKLKYLPLYMMPLTNISVSESTNVTPKTTPHLEDSKVLSIGSKVNISNKAPPGDSVTNLLPKKPVLRPLSICLDNCQLENHSANIERSLCPAKMLQGDIKSFSGGSQTEEGILLCEMSQDLTYIDAAEETEDTNLLPSAAKMDVTRL